VDTVLLRLCLTGRNPPGRYYCQHLDESLIKLVF